VAANLIGLAASERCDLNLKPQMPFAYAIKDPEASFRIERQLHYSIVKKGVQMCSQYRCYGKQRLVRPIRFAGQESSAANLVGLLSK
jgi:hypothetical protein